MSNTSDERRTRARQRSFLQGCVYFNNRRSSLDCLVRDICGTGAKLKVSDSVAIPEIVEHPQQGRDLPRQGAMADGLRDWRDVRQRSGGTSIVPSAAPTDLPERVRRLDIEVASLHRKVNELQNELRQREGSGI